jgi:predicted amidohydrolase YtcJ
MLHRCCSLLCASALLLGAPALAADGEPATIYTAARFITMERESPEAEAIAVVGKRIVALGTLAEVRAALGDTPHAIDERLKDKVVMPGFIEQHLHPFLGAMLMLQEIIANDAWELPERSFAAATTPEQYRQRLAAAATVIADPQQWLFSWGYHRLWHGELSRSVLDEISQTRPILVWQRSVHEFYLNTAAIEALQLDREAMQGHGIASSQFDWERGHWWENGASEFVLPKVAPIMASPERMTQGLQRLVTYLHQQGVTAFNEPGAVLLPGLWQLYQQQLGAADVPLYSTFFPDARSQMNQSITGEAALAEAATKVALGTEGKVAMLPRRIKLFADGAIVSQFMQMKGGYLDGHHGEWMMPPEALESYGKLYWDAGYQLHIHVTGDLGLDVVLDMLERRMRETPRPDHRTVIVHFANSTEEQVARIARLGAVVSSNPYYPVAFGDMYARHGLGPERAHAMARQGSVIRHGIPLSFHSDLPVSPTGPLYQAWMAVTRHSQEGNVLAPDQRIGVEHALRAITIEAAHSWGKEDEIGSLAAGKIANFTVLEQDPYAVDPMALKDIQVAGTVFEGRYFPVPPRRHATTGIALQDPLAADIATAHEHASADACGAMRQLAAALEPLWAADTALLDDSARHTP